MDKMMIRNEYTEDFELDQGDEDDDNENVNVEYDITSYPSDFTLKGLYDMFNHGDITIPDYQRGFVWSIKQSSLLIESFLIGLPVPPIFFYIDDDNKNLVIDGQQRLLSIVYFFEGYFGDESLSGNRQVFKLSGLHKKNRYYNKRFFDLEEKDKRKLETSVLRAINIRQLSPRDGSTSVFHIFERLNTGGTPLKPQEIRNCVFRSNFIKRLQDLNNNLSWRKILNKSLPSKYQTDVELILRIYGLSYHLANYEKPMKEFLNKVAKKNKKEAPMLEDFTIKFKRTTEIICEKLRPKPFNVRGPFNTSAFDSVFCTILNNIDNLPPNLFGRYEDMLQDEKFTDYTTLATTDEKILKARFEYVKHFLIDNDI